ncbi:MAG: Wzz/FepE/Etk N-terminal domain-containing protein [Candidatus Dormibacteraeota bacterium]|nr:Wzz/FepE/Etk N-terminal domain-containing protein [Candidatus Dormibacteraeota bacterium]
MSAATGAEALWRQRYVVLATAAIFLLTGAVASVVVPKTYGATATVFLDTGRNRPNFDQGLTSSDLLAHDFIVLATKRPVLSEACSTPAVQCTAREMASPDTELSKRVAVNTVNGTSMLAVKARAPTGSEAAALANAVANAMIDHDRAELDRLFKPSEDALDTKLDQLQTTIASEQKAIQQATPGGNLASHQAALTFLTTQFTALEGRRQDMRALHQQMAAIATVIESATPPAKPADPDPLRYLLAALVLGVALGILAALLRQRLDDRLYDREGLATAAGTPTVIVTPKASPKAGPRLASYALAHAHLLAQYPEMRKVLVAAASSKDRSDGVAAGLGTVAAQAGQRVLLVQTESLPGASLTDLTLLPNGDASRLTTLTVSTNGEAQAAALALANGQYDFTVLAVPPLGSSPFALSAARMVDGALLVATAGVTHSADVRRTAKLLRELGANVVASILVPKERTSRGRRR